VNDVIDAIYRIEGKGTTEVSDGTTSDNESTNRTNQKTTVIEKVIEDESGEHINEIQPSSSGLQLTDTSNGPISRPTRKKTKKRLTGEQILAKLKNSISCASEVDVKPYTIKDLNDAKEVIKKKLSSIEYLYKLTIKTVCSVGECLRSAKKMCKQRGLKFEKFLSEIEIRNIKMKAKTAAHYVRIYKLCKEYPKFLSTTKSFRFYIDNHKIIRETLFNDSKEHEFWSKV
jgi:hypothetical protein